MSRRVTAIYRQRILTASDDDSASRESADNHGGFLLHLRLLSGSSEPKPNLTEESLQLAQLAQSSRTGAAVAQMTARFASGKDAIARKVRERQDMAMQMKALDGLVIKELGKPNAERNTVLIDNLRSQINDLAKQLATVDADIAQRFPEYQTLVRPEPLSVKHIQKLLKPAEALVTFAFDDKKGWLWVIRKNNARWLPLAITQKEVTAMVKGIRQELDAAGTSLKLAEQPLHTLYRKLLGPAEPHLKDVRHLIIVPDGALQSLPFGLLATKPMPKIKRTQDYRQVDWLAKRYAISVLPAVSSLKALRYFAKEKPGEEPFAGFGDPLLGEGDGDVLPARGVLRKVSLQRGIANANDLRMQPRLPDTADELKALARTLNAGDDALWLQDRATEGNVKKLSLKHYNTLAFATHGVLAGEITGTSEPGLILTPPWESTADEDGYLSAGEVALLKLNADWVLLSACNTAGADGTPGAEGLSGLAKAFFYAGARTLFVSHWKVDSGATVQLTTKTIAEHRKNPQAGKAEAHRKAMLALMNDPEHPEYADPFYWAPFVVVGEGAR
jgi:CHAT domain-containing protein